VARLPGLYVGYRSRRSRSIWSSFAVAGGAILYVIGEIWHGMRRYGHRESVSVARHGFALI